MRVDVVVNRNAHRLGDEATLRSGIAAAARRGGAYLHETRSLAELRVIAHDIAARGTDAVVLAGGDGSYMAGMSAIAQAFSEAGKRLPRMAFAPGGTVCTSARNLGMCGRRGAWAERIVSAVCRDTARVVVHSTLRVRDGSGAHRIGFIFGAGLVVRFFDAYYAGPRQGVGSAARIVGRIFAGSLVGSAFARSVLEPRPCTLTLDGCAQPTRGWSLVVASVFRNLGLHMLVTYRAGEDTDRFHVVASGQSAARLGSQLPRVLTGLPLRGEPRVDALARSLHLSFHGTATGGYVLDGDVFTASEVHAEAGPRVELLVA
ncbi:MAG: hypothetical protein M3O50_17030 [Myxococcota bacterium]|nr:hypothetical protein [Myxococcota bacterium]